MCQIVLNMSLVRDLVSPHLDHGTADNGALVGLLPNILIPSTEYDRYTFKFGSGMHCCICGTAKIQTINQYHTSVDNNVGAES